MSAVFHAAVPYLLITGGQFPPQLPSLFGDVHDRRAGVILLDLRPVLHEPQEVGRLWAFGLVGVLIFLALLFLGCCSLPLSKSYTTNLSKYYGIIMFLKKTFTQMFFPFLIIRNQSSF